MKLFDWLRQRKNEKEMIEAEGFENEIRELEELEQEFVLDRTRVNFHDADQRKQYVSECCDQVSGAYRIIENAKIEYQLVTDYLNDIQEIDALEAEQRKELNEVAAKILELDAKQQNSSFAQSRITDMQFWFFKKNEEEMPKIIKNMKKEEDYQTMIKSDMHHLEGERGSLYYRREDLLDEKGRLKVLAITILSSFVILSGILLFCKEEFMMDIEVGFLVVMFAALLFTGGIFIKMKTDAEELVYVERSMQKAVSMLNKSKIRYVVTTNALEYGYEKYSVNSCYELQRLWELYLEEKEERDRMRENSVELEFYHEQMIKILRKCRLKDPSVWIHQTAAIVDAKEMVEVRHSLNVRRQHIREKIEHKTQVIAEIKEEMKQLMTDYSDYAGEFKTILNQC